MKNRIENKDFRRLLDAFDSFIKVRNYKTGNSMMYQNTLIEFLLWLEESGINSIKELTSKESIKYFEILLIVIECFFRKIIYL